MKNYLKQILTLLKLTKAEVKSPGDDKGRDIGQVIHDVAPGTSHAFYAPNDQADFAQGITDMAAGFDLIVDDILFLDEPMFQDGVIAKEIDDLDAGGISYFSSAGNDAQQSYEKNYRESGIEGE